MKNVTIIIVSYNTGILLQEAVYSIRKYYPTIKIIIVDNSERHNFCYNAAEYLRNEFTCAYHTGSNIGHGPGMQVGIDICKTEYFLLMDSDVTMNCSGVIERLKKYMTPEVYGIGQVVFVDESGNNCSSEDLGMIPYLHPHFALINKGMYLRCAPIINHGAPLLKSMKDADKKGFSVVGVEWGDNITHHERGTRDLNPPEFSPNNWDKI